MPKRGEKHHNAKLTDNEVREMRNLYQDWKRAGSKKGYASLADVFNCNQWTVRDIVTYRTRIDA